MTTQETILKKRSMPLFMKCELCDISEEPCMICNGEGFVEAGINTGQIDSLMCNANRAKHIDRFLDEYKDVFDKFITWLRNNPYPEYK